MGIGEERTITTSSTVPFYINGNNATSLTLGQNITIRRGSLTLQTANHLIHVQRGGLTMRNDSKIITNIRAVSVSGINAVFKMEGGEISGTSGGYGNDYYGVNANNGGTFEMSGGSVSYFSTDVYIQHAGIFRLSGNARIGTLMLHANNATNRSFVTIIGNYGGTVTRLHLNYEYRGNNWWTNAPVIVNGTANVINMFNNGLGIFFRDNTPISATHILNASGFLILKEN